MNNFVRDNIYLIYITINLCDGLSVKLFEKGMVTTISNISNKYTALLEFTKTRLIVCFTLACMLISLYFRHFDSFNRYRGPFLTLCFFFSRYQFLNRINLVLFKCLFGFCLYTCFPQFKPRKRHPSFHIHKHTTICMHNGQLFTYLLKMP